MDCGGFVVSACKLAVIDGGKALCKAVNEVFGKDILIQRCQVHKKRNVADYLPKEKRETVKRAISEAYNAESYDAAKKLLQNTINWLDKNLSERSPVTERGIRRNFNIA